MREFALIAAACLAIASPAAVAGPNDFNADNHPDLLWSNTANGSTYVWHMSGPPPVLLDDSFIAQIDPSWQVQGVGDFNADGHPDLVWRNTANGNTYVWYLNGAAFISDAFLFSLVPEWVIQGVADFNADGRPDFLMRNNNTGVAFAWFFNDNVAIGDQFLFGIDPVWKVEAVGDVNADGQPDLLFRNIGSGLAFAWFTQWSAGNLSLGGSSAPIFSIDPAWEVVQLEDWNADDNPDLVFRNRNTGVVFVWYMSRTTLLGSDFIVQIDPSWEIVPRRADSAAALVLSVTVSGTGTVTSSPAGIDCPGMCSASFARDTVVTLAAATANGSGYYFQGWSGDCSGAARLDCSVTVDRARAVTAQFAAQTYNTIFVSSTPQPGNRGSAVAYDAVCNTLATAAGINNATGNAYMAWTSDPSSLATSRLGSARGFVRMDGKPFADTVASMLSPTNKIFNPALLDENGRTASSTTVMTGTNANGTVGQNCLNFTNSTGATALAGNSYGGPTTWTFWGAASCNTGGSLLCMMKTKTAALTPMATAGKKIYLSNLWTPSAGGLAAADAQCAADKPAGTGSVRALLATNTSPAASRMVSLSPTFVRPDGQVVGTGARIAAGGTLESGIWQDGQGNYVGNGPEWTGATSTTSIGTNASTCGNWTSASSTATAVYGLSALASSVWWFFATGTACNIPERLYCFEQ